MSFPPQHRTKLHSTNPLERRLNGEIKHRTEVVGIFPDEAAITRLVSSRTTNGPSSALALAQQPFEVLAFLDAQLHDVALYEISCLAIVFIAIVAFIQQTGDQANHAATISAN
jgi:hypothetical protein